MPSLQLNSIALRPNRRQFIAGLTLLAVLLANIGAAPALAQTRWRGFVIGTNPGPNDFSLDTTLRQAGKNDWRANVVRWQMGGGPNDVQAYPQWLDGQIARLRQYIPRCREQGLRVIVDMHHAPGGYVKLTNPNSNVSMNVDQVFLNGNARRMYLASWDKLAREFGNEDIVLGFDILNEPRFARYHHEQAKKSDPSLTNWNRLYADTLAIIRRYNATKLVYVETEYGLPVNITSLTVSTDRRVVYSVHAYDPLPYTAQGLPEYPAPKTYPGIDKLRGYLAPVIKFQNDNRAVEARIYIGEFSVTAHSHGAAQFIADSIKIFEENGWDWTYHAFHEAPIWDPVEPYAGRVTANDGRAQVLRDAFKRNLDKYRP